MYKPAEVKPTAGIRLFVCSLCGWVGAYSELWQFVRCPRCFNEIIQ